jgi:hypothetical protein
MWNIISAAGGPIVSRRKFRTRVECRFMKIFFVVSNVPPLPIVDIDGRTSKVETRVQVERPLAPLGFISDRWT